MDTNSILNELKAKLGAGTGHFKEEIGKIRTGRAHPGMLDGVMVEVYGSQMPLKAAANITAPEAQLLQITPFDANNLKAISEAISANQALGLNPADDGRVVRIPIPPLTEETRQAMVKILNQKVEDALISARQARHEAMRKADDDKTLGKDDKFRLEKQVDEQLAAQKTEIEVLAKTKQQEILTI